MHYTGQFVLGQNSDDAEDSKKLKKVYETKPKVLKDRNQK